MADEWISPGPLLGNELLYKHVRLTFNPSIVYQNNPIADT